jgi:hypothetical protein
VNIRQSLNELLRVIVEEADRNSEFRQRIELALNLIHRTSDRTEENKVRSSSAAVGQRPRNRRPLPVVDPIEVAKSGEAALRATLAKLTLEQLRDVVAEYGMDPGKLVLKWKAADRIIDRIVEISLARAQKGDAFRTEANMPKREN